MESRPAPFPRRRLLTAAGAALAAGPLLAACDAFSTKPSGSGSGSGPQQSAQPGSKQPPQLADQVRAGTLPGLADRLPSEPLVITPVDSAGSYGGAWRTLIPEVEAYDAYGKVGYDNLLRWDPQWTKLIPNLAASWDVSDDGRAFTFKLRQGVKWSDGQPFTSADVVFAYDDALRNETLYPVFPTWLASDGTPARIAAADDVTFTLTFDKPNSFFLYHLAAPEGNLLSSLPRHYLKQFHVKYNSEASSLAKKAGFSSWSNLFFARGGGGLLDLGAWQNTELPTLLAWKVSTPLKGNRLVLERNPYYWKTDPQGRQLPYIDKVIADVGVDPEAAVIKISHGEYSLPDAAQVLPSDKPVYARNREQGRYHFVDKLDADMNNATVFFNLLHKDPAMRAIFQNKNFRIGMSYAINRPELVEAVFQRQGQPYQAAPRPESEFYDEELAKQYTEYSPEKANRYLDRAGLHRRGALGWRRRPDGRPLQVQLTYMIGWFKYFPNVADLISGYWKRVGIDVVVNSQEQTRFWPAMSANKHDAVIYGGDNGMLDAIVNPGMFFPYSEGSYYAIAWGQWYDTHGKTGQRPPAPVRRQMGLYDKIGETLDPDERRKLFMELLKITREQFYVMGTVLPEGHFNVVQDNFHNVPKKFPDASLYPDPGPTMPEQYYVQ